jgi:two-component system, NtrC family, sensor kinase
VRRRKKGGKAGKAQRHKTLRRSNASKTRRRGSTRSDKDANLAQVIRERDEALEQQRATSEVLSVISSSVADAQPVFEIIARSAARLCDARLCHVFSFDGELIHFAATHGYQGKAIEALRRVYPIPPGRESAAARAILSHTTEQIPDIQDDPDYAHGGTAKIVDFRSIVAVPMMKAGKPMGAIALARPQTGYFPERQLELLRSFADQAVIAIENVRLFDEVQKRTAELRESLQQQTATADVLKVISRSTFDLWTVLNTLVESAARVCEADTGIIRRRDGDAYPLAATFGLTQQQSEHFASYSAIPDRGSVFGRAILENRTIHVPDILADPEYKRPHLQDFVKVRAALGVPLVREGTVIGVFTLQRSEPRPFGQKQIELVTTFADQAVIAIENVRLFDEVQKRTEELTESLQQQTATADVLKVISRSVFDLQPVLDTLVATAASLCDAEMGHIFRRYGDVYRLAANIGFPPAYEEFVKGVVLTPGRGTVSGRALFGREAVHVLDVMADPDYAMPETNALGKARTLLGVPLLRENEPIGVIALARKRVEPFSDRQIELVSTFADQAVIAIENVRLFESVETRTRELAKSLEDLRTTQDRLVQTQKLASLGQLTAGIAHEMKNPLNFVNNFSGLSAELIDELQDTLEGLSFDENARAQLSELTDTLRGNLDKVVQHGKRADAIVKNMLLHSRQGSASSPVD